MNISSGPRDVSLDSGMRGPGAERKASKDWCGAMRVSELVVLGWLGAGNQFWAWHSCW